MSRTTRTTTWTLKRIPLVCKEELDCIFRLLSIPDVVVHSIQKFYYQYFCIAGYFDNSEVKLSDDSDDSDEAKGDDEEEVDEDNAIDVPKLLKVLESSSKFVKFLDLMISNLNLLQYVFVCKQSYPNLTTLRLNTAVPHSINTELAYRILKTTNNNVEKLYLSAPNEYTYLQKALRLAPNLEHLSFDSVQNRHMGNIVYGLKFCKNIKSLSVSNIHSDLVLDIGWHLEKILLNNGDTLRKIKFTGVKIGTGTCRMMEENGFLVINRLRSMIYTFEKQ